MKQLLDWLDDRTGYRSLLHEALYERIPGGARWRYVWGSTLVFAFTVQAITGLFLWMGYSPNAQGAWESVHYMQHNVQGGWLLRGIHHFMAQAMVVLLALHLLQVIIDGAYRAPREINFWLGLALMQVVLGLSLTGYLLPWDQKGYWATKVATNIMASTPGIGPQLQRLVVGGANYGHLTLTRFFAIHAGLLPALLVGLLVVHIAVFRRHGITAHKPDSRRDATFWPDQVLKDAVACLAVLCVVLLLVFLPYFQGRPIGPELGADLGPPADPNEQYGAARPEWYFLFLFELLKHVPEIVGAHIIPFTALTILALMPFIARWKYGHRFNVGFVAALGVGVVVLTTMAIRADRQDEQYLRARQEAEHASRRMTFLVAELGLGYGGGLELARSDPLLRGPKLFSRNCAGCHRFHGHDGTDHKPAEEPTAADLGNFGTREWIRSVLVDYRNHFAPLARASWNGEPVGANFLEGDMAEWSADNRDTLLDPANAESLAALVEFLFAQGRRRDLPPPDPALVAQGKEIFVSGELASGELTSACAECHSMHAIGDEEPIAEDGYAPNLTGYGSIDWLKSFVADPGAEQHYGGVEKNAMPAFRDRLTEQEIELLARWIVRDYPGAPRPSAEPAQAD